ncbi:MAG: 5-methyltetrahydropteroyltriglutamate--homocysteine S-methyltransferase [Gemmatimonas sp.]|nr:5-methyltetrahydropteroyltriglutamate--homocysteine S-methyltransferase [Gemmatimonas sp.]
MLTTTNLGFPRIGVNRELKRVLESFWRGTASSADLLSTARELRARHWRQQRDHGIEHIPSNDFSLYDHVLDTAAMVGAVPQRFGWAGGDVDLDTYFAMARGVQEKTLGGAPSAAGGTAAMEMTKWFDTNYHYIVPELGAEQRFSLASTKPLDEFLEAKALGILTRPVLLGPVSFLLLSKAPNGDVRPLDLLDSLLPVYGEVLARIAERGAEWVQLDEPYLACDLEDEARQAFATAYRVLAPTAPKILLATYFGPLDDNLETAVGLPVAALHLDLVRGPGQFEAALAAAPDTLALSLGVIDGRNVWRADLDAAAEKVRRAVERLGSERVLVGPSCSLLHVPVDLGTEEELDDEARQWLAFARQKLDEVRALGDPAEAEGTFAASRAAREGRSTSPRIHDPEVERRLAEVTPAMLSRKHPFAERAAAQRQRLGLPLLPTTTIGSFPQTLELRRARSALQTGTMSETEYDAFIADQIDGVVRFQEEAGLDVLVHGEPERSDMVEFFGERLNGFLFTRNGWVQSYGSRCVRPPIIFGDVSRPEPMTVRWSAYAQSRTARPMKGMLTGPVTILQWSFVRDDQPQSETCRQIALAMRDEVADLVRAGLPIVQIDEPALREGLPLRRADQPAYLEWAVDAFRLASAGVDDDVQIHTHMCYAEFGEIIGAIAAMDADVISMESSRSRMELLGVFRDHAYPNDIGPGVYDIHSPLVPSAEEQRALLERALEVIEPQKLWVNPDCGLKTRRWEEVRPALEAMVQAAAETRAELTRRS